MRGGNGLCDGPVDPTSLPTIMDKVHRLDFGHIPQVGTALYSIYSANFLFLMYEAIEFHICVI